MKIKRIISLLIASIISVSMFTLPAFADTATNSSDFTIKNGVLTKYNGNGGDVTIPSNVTSIGDSAFFGCEKLISVSIPNSVTSIGNGAFAFCKGLTAITIPGSVTSIGNEAFSICTSLTTIAIPNSVTTIGNEAFNSCTSLTSITIPSSVTTIGDNALVSCTSLSKISVDANNPNYTSEDGVLFSKDKTKLFQYPAGNTQTAYSIPNGVTSIGDGAFIECECLTSITIPNSVTSIGMGAFLKCIRLASIIIPSSVISIGDEAFIECECLTSITIPSSVISIGRNMFFLCENLSSISVDAGNPNYTSEDGVLFSKDKTKLINCLIDPKQRDYAVPSGVTSIGDYAFVGCVKLTSVSIPSSVTSIGDNAFAGCGELILVRIPSSVTSIGDHAFDYCENIIYGSDGSYAQKYAKSHNISFFTDPATETSPSFGTATYSTTALTNKNVTVTVPVDNATVSSVSHTFISNGSYTFTVADKVGNKATKTVTVSNIDKKKPNIKVSIGNGKKTRGKVTVTVSDINFKSKSVKLNGKVVAWPKNNIFKAKGNYAITATDRAGNTSTVYFSIVK